MAEYGFLIPVYNHGAACLETVRLLLPYGLPLIIVDDGSDAETKQALGEAAALSPLVHLVVKAKNGGKGSAVSAGFLTARKMGLDHVLQLDADRQHDISAVPRFLEISHAHPSSLILGYPIYDASVPESRKKGREVSNVFARIVTCNKDIRDVLCGFRVYPVGPACHVVSHGIWDMRMRGSRSPILPADPHISSWSGTISASAWFSPGSASAPSSACLGWSPGGKDRWPDRGAPRKSLGAWA